ncbi:MAG: isoamylase early set domain-containing protein [Bacteroidota bacterium]
MITKKFLKSKPVCKVTFKLPKNVSNGAGQVFLVGDFNEWNKTATPMKGLKDGSFSTTVDLAQGQEYAFRYLIDGAEWANETEADKTASTPFPDAVNSVVIV